MKCLKLRPNGKIHIEKRRGLTYCNLFTGGAIEAEFDRENMCQMCARSNGEVFCWTVGGKAVIARGTASGIEISMGQSKVLIRPGVKGLEVEGVQAGAV